MAGPHSSPQVVQMMRAAVALHQQGKLAEARAAYQRVLVVEPNNADALHLLGLIAHNGGAHATAIELIARAVQIEPNEATFHLNLGVVLQTVGDFAQAEAAARRATALDPALAPAHANHSAALKELGRLDEAERAARRAIELSPNMAGGHLALGNVLHTVRRSAEADVEFERALKLGSPRFGVLSNWGDSLRVQQRWSEGQAMLEEAIAMNPTFAGTHWNLALLLLQTGQWKRGFEEYEFRMRLPNVQQLRKLRPELESLALNGRSVLIHAEQGLGDTIQFSRYAALLGRINRASDRPGRIVMGVQREVRRLMGTVANIDQIIGDGEAIPEVDVLVSLLSLPRLFGTTVETVPHDVPYVSVPGDAIARWEERLLAAHGNRRAKKRIGLVWAGSATHTNDHNRSIDPRLLLPLVDAVEREQTQWVSLQVGSAGMARERLPVAFAAVDFTSELTDFSDTGALVSCLDLVIAVDTSTAHLTGALGKPVWLLLPTFPDWRWLMEREETVWYPTMRLFRQQTTGDWSSVIAQIANELKKNSSDVEIL